MELRKEFPYLRGLNISTYTKEPYSKSKYRRCKLIIILGSMMQCPAFRALSSQIQDQMVESVEKGCLNHTIRKAQEDNINRNWKKGPFKLRYSSLVAEVVESLDFKYNQWLMHQILCGKVRPKDVGSLNLQDMSQVKADLKLMVEKRKEAVVTIKTTTLYTCPECGKKEAYFNEVQLRSGDENKDTYLFCKFCSHDWIERG